MYKVLLSYVFMILLVLSISQTASANDDQSSIQLTKNLASNKLSFTANHGQWDENLKFQANAGGATIWFSTDCAFYQFTRTAESSSDDKQPKFYETMMIKAKFVGAKQNAQMVGVDMIDYKCNYFIGNDKSKWATDVPNYRAVMYEEIYDGIDLKYYGNGKQMEYDFIVSPGADFSQIKIQYEGAESVEVNENGQLVVTTIWGEVVEQRPVIYQLAHNNRIPIEGKYILQDENSFGFELSADYNSDLPLVIDPVLTYSTYLGNDDEEQAYSIAVDNNGNAIVTGTTVSAAFPTLNPYQVNTGPGGDVVVTKLNNTGDALLYSTYLGGTSGSDCGYGIAVDTAGNIYVGGSSGSTDFPVMNAIQSTYGGGFNDCIIFKLNSAGDSLLFSTFLGGSLNEFVNDLAIDMLGNVFITGRTNSTNFPMQNAFQNSFGGNYDAYVTKFNSAGDTLLFSSYLGGADWDQGIGIDVDQYDNTYLTGMTASTDFPMMNAYQLLIGGGNDAFITKIDSAGTTILFSTYFGGTNDDAGYAITLDDSSKIYITGKTLSGDFPTQNAYQSVYAGTSDVFATKFNSNGDTLVYSTYLGGTGDDYSNGIAVDSVGQVYITGSTRSTDFPIRDASQVANGGAYDAFVSVLSDDGSALLASTYLGGYDWDHGYGIVLTDNHSQYIAGYAWSNNFPTVNPYQSTFGGYTDAFVAQFSIVILDVSEYDIDNLPSDFKMSQNYPNPFNPTTTIEFNLPTKSNVAIRVYNLLGQEVKLLVDQEFSAGNYKVTWDGTASDGVQAATGMYFYRLETDHFVETKKMLLLK